MPKNTKIHAATGTGKTMAALRLALVMAGRASSTTVICAEKAVR